MSQVPDTSAHAPASAGPARLSRILPWLVASAFALLAAWFVGQRIADRDEISSLRVERKLAVVSSKIARSQLAERTLLAERMINELGASLRQAGDLSRLQVSPLAPVAGFTGAVQATVVWDPAQQAGLLTADRLPATTDATSYQLWLTAADDTRPVSAGVFQARAGVPVVFAFKPVRPVHPIVGYVVTREARGGAGAPAGPTVVQSRDR